MAVVPVSNPVRTLHNPQNLLLEQLVDSLGRTSRSNRGGNTKSHSEIDRHNSRGLFDQEYRRLQMDDLGLKPPRHLIQDVAEAGTWSTASLCEH